MPEKRFGSRAFDLETFSYILHVLYKLHSLNEKTGRKKNITDIIIHRHVSYLKSKHWIRMQISNSL